MPRLSATAAILLCTLSLAACTYGIRLDPGGERVRTAWNGNSGIRGCRDVGKVTVSVLSRIGPIDRNDIKVRDELEIMARNQAAQMRADTITPLGDPRDGEQAWEAWDCGNAPPPGPPPDYTRGPGAPVEEVPVDRAPPDNAMPPDAPTPSPPPPSPPPGNVPSPPPFSAPLPAGSSAQTYPMSGSTG
mgnify:FL=1